MHICAVTVAQVCDEIEKNIKFQEVKKMKKEYKHISVTVVSLMEDVIRTSGGDNYISDWNTFQG